MISLYIAIALVGILSAVVSGNNISAAVGTIIGSRIVSRNFGLTLGAAGFSIGLITEGRFLSNSLFLIMPERSNLILIVLGVSIVMFIIATFARIPLSLIMAIVGTSIGIGLKTGYNYDSVYITMIIALWILAPVLAILSSYFLNLNLNRISVKNVWKTARFYKLFLVLISFLTAFSLGANTFGLLASLGGSSDLTILIMIIAIFLGAAFMSSGVIRRVSQDMYGMRYQNATVSLLVSSLLVEGATFFSLPLPSTQTLTSSVFGTGLSYKTKAMQMRPFLIIVIMWIVSPVLGMILGYIIA
jgi:PiT family inorganic phosphate transporter